MQIFLKLLDNCDLTRGSNLSSNMSRISAAKNLAQSFQSFNLTYKDTALWGAYFVGQRIKQEEVMFPLMDQWKRLCVQVTNNQIRQGKNNLLTKIISQREGSISNANSIASDILLFGRRISLEEWQCKIQQVNSAKMQSVAENYIWDRCPSVSARDSRVWVSLRPFFPTNGFACMLHMKMSWYRY